MTNEEARRILLSDSDFSGIGEKAKLTADALCIAVEALEKQRYIDAKIEWLKTLNPYDVILVSDVLDWFEDAKVEDD